MNKYLKLVLIILGIFLVLSIGLAFASLFFVKAEKPAIYLYPIEDTQVSVKLDINGLITESIPEYTAGWDVFATKEGLIDGRYNYLFYENFYNHLDIPKEGWVVSNTNLEEWFETNLISLGLNQKRKINLLNIG